MPADASQLRSLLRNRVGNFLMTINTDYILGLAAKFGFETRLVAMKSSHHAKMTELLISRNLDWLPAQREEREVHVAIQASLEFEPQTAPC